MGDGGEIDGAPGTGTERSGGDDGVVLAEFGASVRGRGGDVVEDCACEERSGAGVSGRVFGGAGEAGGGAHGFIETDGIAVQAHFGELFDYDIGNGARESLFQIWSGDSVEDVGLGPGDSRGERESDATGFFAPGGKGEAHIGIVAHQDGEAICRRAFREDIAIGVASRAGREEIFGRELVFAGSGNAETSPLVFRGGVWLPVATEGCIGENFLRRMVKKGHFADVTGKNGPKAGIDFIVEEKCAECVEMVIDLEVDLFSVIEGSFQAVVDKEDVVLDIGCGDGILDLPGDAWPPVCADVERNFIDTDLRLDGSRNEQPKCAVCGAPFAAAVEEI